MVECNVHCLFVSITHGTKRDHDDDVDDDVSCENTSAPMLLCVRVLDKTPQNCCLGGLMSLTTRVGRILKWKAKNSALRMIA